MKAERKKNEERTYGKRITAKKEREGWSIWVAKKNFEQGV